MTIVLGCSTRIGHGARHLGQTRSACRLRFAGLGGARIEPDAMIDVSRQPFRGCLPGVSLINKPLSASAECSAKRRVAQQMIEPICELCWIVAIYEIPRATVFDEIRNCTDVGGDYRQAMGERFEKNDAEGLDGGRQTEYRCRLVELAPRRGNPASKHSVCTRQW
jgi:hypothetical protein